MNSKKESHILKIGDLVRVQGSSMTGVINKIDSKKNIAVIESKGILVKISLEKVSLAKSVPEPKAKKYTTRKVSEKIPKLDLHGLTKSEAENQLLHFFNKALLENCGAVEIIHGHGEGIIKNLVHSFLKNNTHVAECRYKDNNTGTTIAYLR